MRPVHRIEKTSDIPARPDLIYCGGGFFRDIDFLRHRSLKV